MCGVIPCVVGWENQRSQPSFGNAHPCPYLGSIIGMRAIIFFLVEVGIAVVLSLEVGAVVVLSLEAKQGTILGVGSTS